MTATVYRVTCIPTGASYIGSTSQAITRRFNEHRSRLATGIHENRGLQEAWDLHGADAFTFAALLVVPEEDRAQAEQDCIHATPGALNVTSPVARSRAKRRADRVDARVRTLLGDRGWPLDSAGTLGPSRTAPEPTPSQIAPKGGKIEP